MKSKMLPLIMLFVATANAVNIISIYGDLRKDTSFFDETYPWIIDNIGGDIIVDYYMLGTGRTTVPQMCVLKELRSNTFLQAQYLKCEAQGNPSKYCICLAGIDPERFRKCVASGGHLARIAVAKFSELDVNATTPIIVLGRRNPIYGLNRVEYLQEICSIFGKYRPRACDQPFDYGEDDDCAETALAQIDRECTKKSVSCDVGMPTTNYIY